MFSYIHCITLSYTSTQILINICNSYMCRILEADTKSLKSISSEGRRHSTSSDESHTSMLSTGVNNDDDSSHGNDSNSKQWQLWGHIVNDWEDYKKKNGKQLKVCIGVR